MTIHHQLKVKEIKQRKNLWYNYTVSTELASPHGYFSFDTPVQLKIGDVVNITIDAEEN